eukprot:9142210-Pyramimonas_sp.AAC.1
MAHNPGTAQRLFRRRGWFRTQARRCGCSVAEAVPQSRRGAAAVSSSRAESFPPRCLELRL